ncbi:MAG TPA: SEC-C domain-containing protein [Polyangia bacterium]|nr:SEC-C domain-containing protein [Polyangia bacterium]
MARTKTTTRIERWKGRNTQEIAEWVGGRLSPPFFITEGEPYRPEMIIWMELPTGLVVGYHLTDPKEPADLGSILLAAMERPIVGPPRQPARIRVASADMAASVRRAVGDGIDVSVAPTPELNEVLEHMRAGISGAEVDQSYLEEGRVSVETVADLFTAAELLYRVAPWKVMDDDQVVRVDIPRLGIDGACLSVIGALAESIGLLLFPSLEAFESFASSAQVRKPGPVDLGTTILSLSFERGADIPAFMRREISQYGWPVAGPRAYPRVDHRDSDAVPRPLSERDVQIMAACATSFGAFFAKNRGVFKDDDGDAVCESYSDQDDLVVRFTYPYEAAELFDVDEPPPTPRVAEPEIPRNAPCPCGSGRKYKKCHLAIDGARRTDDDGRASVHQIDERVVADLRRFATRRFGAAWGRAANVFADAEEAIQLASPWSVYGAEVEGRPIVDWYLSERGRQLPPDEREWLEAQQRAWMTVWEVTGVDPGRSVTVHDLLTREDRKVDEVKGSRVLAKRDAVLGRVVDHGGISVFCGIHPNPLPPPAAAVVVQQLRTKLRRKAAVPPERLRDDSIGRYMIVHWEEAVRIMTLPTDAPPQLSNTDGDDLLLTADVFTFKPADHGAIEQHMGALDGVEPPDGADKSYTFVRSAKAGGGRAANMVIGVVRLEESELRVETNSVKRADALRRRIEDACSALLIFRGREHVDPLETMRWPRRSTSPVSTNNDPIAAEAVRAFKQRHYEEWADHPLPALKGKTPREAIRTPAGRAAVDVLLKDFENQESRHPSEVRFDFAPLREGLGLPS